jgi:regulatory protein
VYASGHFRLKKWGRLKIKMGLEQKRISPYCIKVGLKEINEEAYEAMIAELLEKKWRSLKDSNDYVRKQKAVRYVMQKGFEPDLIWAAVDTLNLN